MTRTTITLESKHFGTYRSNGIRPEDAGDWVLVRLSEVSPVEAYRVDSDGLEIFRGYLHRCPDVHLLAALIDSWRVALWRAA
ncbi:MAG: hypothetical protein RID81_07090 [Sandaracinaceae bacterium]